MEKKTIEISWASLWRILAMLALVAIFIVSRQAFFAFFLAIVLASAIEPIVSFFEKKRFPRGLAVLMIFIVGLAVLAVLLYTIIPIAALEFRALFSNLEEKLPVFLKPAGSLFLIDFSKGQEGLINALLSGSESFMSIASRTFGNVALVIALFVITFYLTVNKNGVEKFLRAILPAEHEERIIAIYLRIRKKWGHWFQAQLLLSFVIGGISFLGLWLLGVKYSLLLGATAGVLELVPMAGPIIAGVIAFFVALTKSWALAVYVAILFIIIQQLENHILLPLIMRKTMGVEPAVVVLTLLAGYAIASWMGVLLAIPAAVTLQEISEDFSRRKAGPKSEQVKS